MIKSVFISVTKLFRIFSLLKEDVTLICKIDNIGDYILFRNFLDKFKESEFNQNRGVVLIGNVAWKNIFETYDNIYVDRVIWVNLHSLQNNIFYRFGILCLLNTLRIHTIIQPTYSRNLLIDFLLLPLKAKFKYTPLGDDLNHIPAIKLNNDKNYSHIIKSEKMIPFEFDRNLFFFKKLDPVFSKIKFSLPFVKESSTDKIVSFFIGSSSKNRQLSLQNLSYIMNSIQNQSDYQIKILGGKAEFEIGQKLKNLNQKIVNLCGDLTLSETISVIGNSKVVITMDSSGLHMAMGTNVSKVFCFSNGNHIFRFVPYPSHYKNLTVFFPPIIELLFKKNQKILYESFEKGSLVPIDSIRIDLAVKEILKGIHSK